MKSRAWLGLVSLVVGSIAAGGCGKDHSLLDGGVAGDGNGANSGAGQVKVRGIAPARGPLAGGTSIVIDGEGFQALDAGDAIVVLGDRAATGVAVVDDFTITAIAPAGTTSAGVDVIVANRNGYGVLGKGYTYNPLPAVTAVAPPKGDQAGGTHVTVTGTGFQQFDAGSNRLTFGDLVATNVVVASDTSLTADTPPGPVFSSVDVAVSNQNGASGPAVKAYQYTGKGLIVSSALRGVNSTPKGLFFIDPATGLITNFMDITTGVSASAGFNALATDDQGTLWGTTGETFSVPTLVKVDPFAATATDVAPVVDPNGNGSGSALPIDCRDLEFVGATLHCSRARNNTQYTIDTTTGTATLVSTPLQRITVANLAGTVYAGWQTCCPGQFSTVDLATGTLGTATTITLDGATFNNRLMKATALDGAMYFIAPGSGGGSGFAPPFGSGPSNRELYRLDVATGVATAITFIPFGTSAMTKSE